VTGSAGAAPATGRGTRVVAAGLLVLAAAVALVRLPGELSRQADAAATGRAMPAIASIPVQDSIGTAGTQFLALVRRTVPGHEPVRVVQPVTPVSRLESRTSGHPGVCGYAASGLTYYWLAYALVPHPMTCDPNARWTLYARVAPPHPLPPGASVSARSGTWTLVHR
jgi:hypothetical protein